MKNDMKRKASDPLRDALASLVRSEAMLVESQAGRDREIAEWRRSIDDRFHRIEAILLRLVEVLPDAVRERIGIKPEPQT